MVHEHIENLFLVHIPSILHGALVGCWSYHCGHEQWDVRNCACSCFQCENCTSNCLSFTLKCVVRVKMLLYSVFTHLYPHDMCSVNWCSVDISFAWIYPPGEDRICYLFLIKIFKSIYSNEAHTQEYVNLKKYIPYSQPWIHIKNTCIQARYV